MINVLKLSPATIITYLEHSHNNNDSILPPEPNTSITGDIQWVLSFWPEDSIPLRTLKDEHYQVLKQKISQVPTGKQKHYRWALNAILIYLNDIARWELPERTKAMFVDRDFIWFNQLSKQAELADTLWQTYEIDKANILQTHVVPTPAQVALTIAIEVAPLSLNHLATILNEKASIERTGQQTQLKVMHYQQPLSTTPQINSTFTRYHLPLYSYCLLDSYYKTKPSPISVRQLYNLLNDKISSAPYHIALCKRAQWHTLFQSLWHYRDNIPSKLLKDIAQPERHVDFDVALPSAKQKKQMLAGLYQQDWRTNKGKDSYRTTNSEVKKPRWAQRQLITQWSKNGDINSIAPPDLNPNNIIEYYLFLYCRELILYGGVQATVLSKATITKYCNIEVHFNGQSLLYEMALDNEQLQEWAKRIYEQQESETIKGSLRYFFRFLSTQALTDHLDIAVFESPSLAPTVDPFRIPLTMLHEMVNALLTQSGGTLLQRFYCAVAAIIAYFAMLRRGEVLRLRIKDIFSVAEKSNAFHLTITKTKEGIPKGKKTRDVDTVLPEAMAMLVRIAIQLKEESDNDDPLIGFDNEKMSSRQLNYLLPVTKAIKAHCGQAARFHHLRKSGIHLFTQQMLHIAYLQPGHDLVAYEDLKPMLSREMVKKRFNYWTEKREESEINDNLLFVELGRQIGHKYYATTRWSYLHGTQWLFPYLRPKQTTCAQQAFSHAELRFLLGLAPDSNDLSRKLSLLSEDYKRLSITQKQKNPVMLSEQALRSYLWPSKANNKPESAAEKAYKEPKYYYALWQKLALGLCHHFIDALFISMRKKNYFNFPVLSQVWQHSGRHTYRPLSKTQRTALAGLGPITLFQSNIEATGNDQTNKQSILKGQQNSTQHALQIQVASNARNAAYFEAVFRQPEWQWLTCSFVLTVNRKTKEDRLLILVKTRYAKNKEEITVKRTQEGASSLIIRLTPIFPVSKFVLQQALQTLTS